MNKVLISLSLLAFVALNAQTFSLEDAKKIALKASKEVSSTLKKELKKAKKAKKTEGMANFCIDESVKIIEKIDKKYGNKISIKRISLNNRNDKSKALKDEINLLKAFDLIQKADAYAPKQIVQIVDDNSYKIYSPIQMKSRDCKKCHGLEKKIDKNSQKRFLKVYKNDRGYGHKSGEIRGAVVITVSK